MSAGAFNTREFFHGASLLALRNVRWAFVLGLFVLPLALQLCALTTTAIWPWAWAALLQAPSLIAERWVFFAQAKHPQNLYYQVVG
jgi:DMSO reductase anchor subunit